MLNLARVYVETQQSGSQSARNGIVSVAYAFAAYAPLPLMYADDLRITFMQTVRPSMNELLNQIVEACPIRVAETQELIYKLWAHRARMVHPRPHDWGVDLLVSEEEIPADYLECIKELKKDGGWLSLKSKYMMAAYTDAGNRG